MGIFLLAVAGCTAPCGQIEEVKHPLLRVTTSSGGPAPIIGVRTILDDGRLEFQEGGISKCVRLNSFRLAQTKGLFGVDSKFERDVRALRIESEMERCCDREEISIETQSIERILLFEDVPGSLQNWLSEIDVLFEREIGDLYSSHLAIETADALQGLDLAWSPPPSQCGKEPIRMTADIEAPVAISKVPARKPVASAGDEPVGSVILEIVINRNGIVASARILRSIGTAADAAAMDAIKQWRYQPAKCEGYPVAVYYTVSFTFEASTGLQGHQ